MAKVVRVREDAKKFLADVPEEYVFWCYDGRTFRNVKELGEALNTMTDETFVYHVNREKNDFSNWVREIIKDEQLARYISPAMTRREMANIVARRIASLSGRM